MRWSEALHPVTMTRVAVMAPAHSARDVLVQVADAGLVELDDLTGSHDLEARAAPGGLALSPTPPDPDDCERLGRTDVLEGERALQARVEQAIVDGSVVGLVGWMPTDDLAPLAERVADIGGAVVPLPRPFGVDVPSLLPAGGVSHALDPLVSTYAAVPYEDVNPSVMAGLAYVVMFGMMFADAGHGLLLLLVAVAARWGPWSLTARLRPVWLFLAGAGLFSAVFGALYGEFFGPTGVVPVVWLAPLTHPVTLLVAAVGVGAVLLGGAYALGAVNRFREGGWRRLVYAPTGLAGTTLFVGVGAVTLGVRLGLGTVVLAGALVAGAGLLVAYVGLMAAAGGRGVGAAQAAIELFDLVIRLGSNVVSFARLAAFGLTHAAMGLIVWRATSALFGTGLVGAAAGVAVFIVGNAATFALEGLVAAVQALRLEYYELFSRVFASEGRPFRPWHIPLSRIEVSS